MQHYTNAKRFRLGMYLITLTRPFTPNSAESNIDKISKITNWVKNKQQHIKVPPNSFPMNGHTLGFCPQNQKLENFASPKVTCTKPIVIMRPRNKYNNIMLNNSKRDIPRLNKASVQEASTL